MMCVKDFLRVLLFPLVLLKRYLYKLYLDYVSKVNPQKFAEIQYKQRLGTKINWSDPQTINEKIQWLKFYSNTSEWSRLSDKYRVREYIKEKGLEKLLVGLYGVYDNACDIEWSKLPEKFVIKVNNGSGDICICKKKPDEYDIKVITEKFNNLLKLKFWQSFAEPHYSSIKPCIIVEELLDSKNQQIDTNTLIDYKVWCFNGNPYCIWSCYNRTPKTVEVGTYDLEWNYHEEWSSFTDHYIKAKQKLPKPVCLQEMLNCAKILSSGFPQVRVDFYIVGNKLYFGEMTFTSKGGYMDFYTEDFLLQMGKHITLPEPATYSNHLSL